MKKVIILIFLVSNLAVFSQNSLKLKSIEYGFGTYKISNRSSVLVFSSTVDLTASFKNNLISLSNNLGYGFGRNEMENTDLEGFYEIDLLYGREFKIAKKIKIETYSGLGFITQNNTTQKNEKQSWAVPLKAKILFYTNSRFAMALNPTVSFNKVNTIYTLNFILHLNF